MNEEQLRTESKKLAETLCYSPKEPIIMELRENDFMLFISYFLNHYGGSLSQSLLLKCSKRILMLNQEQLKWTISQMNHNPALGVDAFLQFYGNFTQIKLSEFGFLDEIQTLKKIEYNVKESYGARYFIKAHANTHKEKRKKYLNRLYEKHDLKENEIKQLSSTSTLIL